MNDMQFVNPTTAGIDYPNAIAGTAEGVQGLVLCTLYGFGGLMVQTHGCPCWHVCPCWGV